MLEHDQIKILMRLHELEQSLAAMYALFSEKFPAHRDLWSVLIKEELEHADAVQELYRRTYENAVFFPEGATRCDAVESTLAHVKNMCERARLDKVTAEEALDFGCDIENSLIAKNIFDHFEVDPDFTAQLRYLRDSSEKHAQLVQREIDRLAEDSGITEE
jgi:hypothetical protein